MLLLVPVFVLMFGVSAFLSTFTTSVLVPRLSVFLFGYTIFA